MATLLPLYRLTVYAPRLEDPTETTVMTPAAGAPHSDPFVVTSLQGVAGAKPYLGTITGRQGTLDPITKRTTTGDLTIPVFDPRVTVGGSNAARWMSAFLGDTLGRSRLKGCRFTLERSLDGTSASLVPYFAGRIHSHALSGPQWVALTCKDAADDLNRDVFTGAPDPAVTYANPATIFPVGLVQPYGPFTATVPPLRGTFRSGGFLDVDLSQDGALGIITQIDSGTTLTATQKIVRTVTTGTGAIGYYTWKAAGAALPIPSTGAQHYRYQWFQLDAFPLVSGAGTVSCSAGAATFSTSQAGVLTNGMHVAVGGTSYLVSAFNGTTGCTLSGSPTFSGSTFFVAKDLRYTPLPAGGVAVTFTVYADAPPSASLPLLINDVHPVQHLADVLDGKFSRRPGESTTRALVGRDPAVWAPFIADASFGTIRLPVTAQQKANDYLQARCQSLNLGLRFDESGKVVPVDLRRNATTLTTALLLTDTDLVDDVEPTWADSRDGAVTGVKYTYYTERQLSAAELSASTETHPPYPASTILSTAALLVKLNDLSTLVDVGEKWITIDGTGNRTVDGDTSALEQQLTATILEFLRPFGSGTLKAKATYRLLAPNIVGVVPGSVRLVQHTKLPDPSTNRRGGTRLMLCLSRQDTDGRAAIDWLDCGANAVAGVPAITSLTTPSRTSVAVAVTLNAAGDPAELWLCATPTSTGTRPGDSDARWLLADRFTSAGTLTEDGLASGSRIWARARSQGSGSMLTQPSAFVYPSGAGYVDLSGLTAPSALVVTTPSGDVAHLAWANGESTLGIEVLLVAGTTPGTWLDAYQLGVALTAGTIATDITSLTAGATYSVGIRHRDPVTGATSAVTSSTFTAGAVTAVLSTPLAPTAYSSGRWRFSTRNIGTQIGVIRYGLAVQAVVVPGQVEFRQAIETAPGSGVYGAYGSVALVDAVASDWTLCQLAAASDGCRRRLSARSVSGPATSLWTTDVEFDPSIPLFLQAWVAGTALSADGWYMVDRTGAVLIDVAGKEIKNPLAIGSGVRGAADVAFGSTVKYAPNRHTEQKAGKDGDTLIYGVSFDNSPKVVITPVKYLAPTAGNVVEFSLTGGVGSGTLRCVQTSGATTTARTDTFASSLNGTPTGGIFLQSAGAAAYCNLANADGTSITYQVNYDIDTTPMDAFNTCYVSVYTNRGTADNTNWDLVGSANFGAGVSSSGLGIQFTTPSSGTGQMLANYDVRVVISYQFPATGFKRAGLTVNTVTYSTVAGGTTTSLANFTGASVQIAATEAA